MKTKHPYSSISQVSATLCWIIYTNSKQNTLGFVVGTWQDVKKLKRYENFYKALDIMIFIL